MIDDLIKFVKEHPYLCIGTMGFSCLGYLGYRSVIWIIEKCEKLLAIDKVAAPILKNPPMPKNALEIREGYGEYIVFKIDKAKAHSINFDQFEKVHHVFQKYSPGSIAARFKNQPKEGLKAYENRYESLRNEVKLIDRTLEIAFIPKVLYELSFLHQKIKEDIDAVTPNRRLEKKQWSLPRFADNGNLSDVHQKEVTELAFRLNKVIFDKIPSPKGCLSVQQIHAMTEQELHFFQDHYKSDSVKNLESKTNPAFCFSASSEEFKNSVNVKPMGFSTETHTQIVKKAVDLECGPLAKGSVFLYRGSDFDKDSPIFADGGDPFALSYGTSCFAGAVYDPGATAFTYMRNEKDAFAHPISFEMIETSPLSFPGADTLRQLHGHGEFFHSRSKLWEKGYYTKEWDLWKSDLPKQEFLKQYKELKRKSIMLKN